MTDKKVACEEYFNICLDLNARFLRIANQKARKEVIHEEPYSISIGYDLFDYQNTLITRQFTRLCSDFNSIQFQLSAFEVGQINKRVEILTSKGILDEIMLTNDVVYSEGDWMHYEPLDIETILINPEEKSRSQLILLTDQTIDLIIDSVFDNRDNGRYV